jgi:hypothetical protein
LLESPDHYQIDHAADHLGAVFNRLGAAQLAVAGGQMHHAAAHLVHASLKAHPCTGGGFLENHGQCSISQRVVLFVGLEFFLDQGGPLKQVGVVEGSEVAELQVVFHCGCSQGRVV